MGQISCSDSEQPLAWLVQKESTLLAGVCPAPLGCDRDLLVPVWWAVLLCEGHPQPAYTYAAPDKAVTTKCRFCSFACGLRNCSQDNNPKGCHMFYDVRPTVGTCCAALLQIQERCQCCMRTFYFWRDSCSQQLLWLLTFVRTCTSAICEWLDMRQAQGPSMKGHIPHLLCRSPCLVNRLDKIDILHRKLFVSAWMKMTKEDNVPRTFF